MVINLSTSREQRNIALKYWVFFIFSYRKQVRWFWKMLCKLIQYFLKRFSELVCLLSSPSASAQLTLNSEFPVISWLIVGWKTPSKINEIYFVTSHILIHKVESKTWPIFSLNMLGASSRNTLSITATISRWKPVWAGWRTSPGSEAGAVELHSWG